MPSSGGILRSLPTADSKRKTLRPKPNLDHGDAQKHSVALGVIRDGQLSIPRFPRVWLRPSGSVWQGEGRSSRIKRGYVKGCRPRESPGMLRLDPVLLSWMMEAQ